MDYPDKDETNYSKDSKDLDEFCFDHKMPYFIEDEPQLDEVIDEDKDKNYDYLEGIGKRRKTNHIEHKSDNIQTETPSGFI